MDNRPKEASEYTSAQVARVRAMCLYVSTKLGDLMEELLVVGGLVPSLIIDQDQLREDVEPHIGTMDLDVGLQVTLLSDGRYQELTERLRAAGFEMDTNNAGKPTRQRWTISKTDRVTMDFLIQPTLADDRGGKLRNLEPDFAAIIAPGLRCAFRDRKQVTLTGTTLFGERATRNVWVCDAGAYVVLKALAFDSRGENKDAYDVGVRVMDGDHQNATVRTTAQNARRQTRHQPTRPHRAGRGSGTRWDSPTVGAQRSISGSRWRRASRRLLV